MKILEEITAQFEETMGVVKTDIIPREKIESWMQSSDIEVLGAVRYLILDKRYFKKIRPPLELKDYQKFLLHYYERCIRENPDGEWSETRYEAGWALVNWFVNLWDDPSVSRRFVEEIKAWMAKLYKDGNEEIRKCLITATLEHLFEKKKIAKYFSDWCEDDILRSGYDEALNYSKELQTGKRKESD